MSKKLDQIRKLIATANDSPDTPEGKTARKIANKKLKKLGLTDADVMLEARLFLKGTRQVWDEALLDVVTSTYPVELRQHVDKDGGTDELRVHGPATVVDQVEYRFHSLRRRLLKRSGDYHRSVAMLVHPLKASELVTVYLNFAVIALSERLLGDDDSEEVEMLEDKGDEEEVLEGDVEQPDGEVAEDLLDKLIAETDKEVEHGLPNALDPALCGYQAGHEVPLTDALTEQAVEEAKQLISRAGFLTEDQTKGLEEDFSTWEDLF